MGVTLKCTYADNKTLDVLADLIAKRVEVLKETSEKAVTATALNIVKSLRAATRVAKVSKSAKSLDAAYVYRKSTFYGSNYTEPSAGLTKKGAAKKGVKHFCIRDAAGHRNDLVKPAFADNPLDKGLIGAPVYYVFTKRVGLTRKSVREQFLKGVKTESAEQILRYVVIAKNEAGLKGWARRHIKHQIEQESGMARYALSILRQQIYAQGRNADEFVPKSKGAFQTAKKSAVVRSALLTNGFSIECEANLAYALSALKKGKASLDEAIKKAANSTAQIINRVGHLAFEERVHTPFPEVASPRRK